MSNVSRIDLRLSLDTKKQVEKAAILSGSRTLTEYIVRLLEKDSARVIAEHETIVLPGNIFDQFIDVCNKAEGAPKKLKEALHLL